MDWACNDAANNAEQTAFFKGLSVAIVEEWREVHEKFLIIGIHLESLDDGNYVSTPYRPSYEDESPASIEASLRPPSSSSSLDLHDATCSTQKIIE